MFRAGHARVMASVNQTRPQCVNQVGKTQSHLLATRHGRGAACYVCISLKQDKIQFVNHVKYIQGDSCTTKNKCLVVHQERLH